MGYSPQGHKGSDTTEATSHTRRRSPQSSEHGSQCYTAGSHEFSILYVASIVYMWQGVWWLGASVLL